MKLILSSMPISIALLSTLAVSEERVSVMPMPEVTFDKVQRIFGHNLDTDDTKLKTLLLAIGVDHTSSNSPHSSQRIGIPYIVHDGPGYWVKRLKSGERALEVMVNNALLLLFTKEEIAHSKESGLALLTAAAASGYWPADYYVAESNLENHLSLGDSVVSPTTGLIRGAVKPIAQDTMNRYNRCAAMGFAPCQYRIGFWLSSTPETLRDGLNILRTAIDTTMKDIRYQGVLDGALIMASNEIVFKGDQVGVGTVVREEYANLVKQQLTLFTKTARKVELKHVE